MAAPREHKVLGKIGAVAVAEVEVRVGLRHPRQVTPAPR